MRGSPRRRGVENGSGMGHETQRRRRNNMEDYFALRAQAPAGDEVVRRRMREWVNDDTWWTLTARGLGARGPRPPWRVYDGFLRRLARIEADGRVPHEVMLRAEWHYTLEPIVRWMLQQHERDRHANILPLDSEFGGTHNRKCGSCDRQGGMEGVRFLRGLYRCERCA